MAVRVFVFGSVNVIELQLDDPSGTGVLRRITYILALILAGEMIFSLPFHTARFFARPCSKRLAFQTLSWVTFLPCTVSPRCLRTSPVALLPTGFLHVP